MTLGPVPLAAPYHRRVGLCLGPSATLICPSFSSALGSCLSCAYGVNGLGAGWVILRNRSIRQSEAHEQTYVSQTTWAGPLPQRASSCRPIHWTSSILCHASPFRWGPLAPITRPRAHRPSFFRSTCSRMSDRPKRLAVHQCHHTGGSPPARPCARSVVESTLGCHWHDNSHVLRRIRPPPAPLEARGGNPRSLSLNPACP